MNTMTAQDKLTAMLAEGGYTLKQIREAQAAARAEAEQAQEETLSEGLNAEKNLADLLQTAESGGNVTATQIVEARAAIELEGIELNLRRRRAATKAEKEQLAAISAAQATVAKTVPAAQASLTKAYTNAVDALSTLGAALHEYDAVVLGAGRTLGAARAPMHSDRTQPEPDIHAIYNPTHAAPEYGVRINGESYPRGNSNGPYLVAAALDAAKRLGRPWANRRGRDLHEQIRRDGGSAWTDRPANLPEGN